MDPRLYEYQKAGVRWLVHTLGRYRRAYLADGMGLGKTPQSIVALRMLPEPPRRTYVVCPASVRPNWRRAWKLWGGPGEVHVDSYAAIVRNGAAPGEWDAVILDEAHYVKSRRAKRTKEALILAANARYAILLSGTPMKNDPRELFPPVAALWPQLIRKGVDHRRWRNAFCKYRPGPFGPKIVGVKNTPELRRIMKKFLKRRTLQDTSLDLPPLRVTTSYVAYLPSFKERVEEEGLEEVLWQIEQEKEVPISSARRELGEYKAPYIAEILVEELREEQYEKIVVLYHHHRTGDLVRPALEPFGLVGFSGRTPAGQRQDAIDRFTEDPEVRVFFAQQGAAGEGINLQVASEIVLLEPYWSPDDNAQAIKRIHRIGQDQPCRARLFAVENSLDVSIMETLARKTQMKMEVGL